MKNKIHIVVFVCFEILLVLFYFALSQKDNVFDIVRDLVVLLSIPTFFIVANYVSDRNKLD